MRRCALLPLASLLPLALVARATGGPPAPSEGLLRVTWREALARAQARNPSAITAAQEIQRAEGLLRQARAAWLPTLSANGSYTILNADRIFGGTVVTPQTSWNGNLLLTVPIVSPIAWVNDAHAQDSRQVAVAGAADVWRQLAAAVGRAYLTVLLQHRELEVAERARATAAAHYDYASARLNAGLGNAVDQARAAQELHTDEAQLQNARTALVRAQSALAVLLSERTLVDAADEVDLGGVPTADGEEDIDGRRADVRAQEARGLATRHLRRDLWVYYAPSLLVQAQAFKETAEPLQPGNGWQATVVLSIPLFDGGARYGLQRERSAQDAEARATLDALLRQVAVEVRTALEVVSNADGALHSARAAAVAADLAAALADRSYRAGASTNIEVIDAQRQARDAGSQVALAEDAARQARLDLLLATGAFP
ncbi:MAG: TolC family protein [Polyangia bacterium]